MQLRTRSTQSPTVTVSLFHGQERPSPSIFGTPIQSPPPIHPEHLPPFPHPPPPSSSTNPTTPPPYTLVTLHNLKKDSPETVTETITIHETIHLVSFSTEQILLTRTDTVYVNETVFIHDTITHTAMRTLSPNPSRMTITTTLLPTSLPDTNNCDSAAAQAFQQPAPIIQDKKPNGAAIAGAVVGSLLGVALMVGLLWFAARKWRAWKAKKNGHMKGVELQRRWEMEQEMRGAREEGGGDV
ncbi:MAG: hypothetical protein Q9178_002563 [Gyalolechia marmorata]